MAVSDAAWDGSASKYDSTADYCNACAINMNTGPSSGWVQAKAKLPYKEPGGAINRNGVHAAAAALAGGRGGVLAPMSVKKAAARKLVSAYGELNEDPPPSLKSLAS